MVRMREEGCLLPSSVPPASTLFLFHQAQSKGKMHLQNFQRQRQNVRFQACRQVRVCGSMCRNEGGTEQGLPPLSMQYRPWEGSACLPCLSLPASFSFLAVFFCACLNFSFSFFFSCLFTTAFFAQYTTVMVRKLEYNAIEEGDRLIEEGRSFSCTPQGKVLLPEEKVSA